MTIDDNPLIVAEPIAAAVTAATTPRSSSVGGEKPFTAVDQWGTVWALVLLCSAIEANAAMLPSLWAVSEKNDDDTSASIRDDLGLTMTDFGLLTSYVSIAPRAVMMYVAGRVAGRVRRKKILVMVAGVLQMLAMGTFLTARGFWQLAVAMVLINISLGIDLPTNAILVGDLFPDPTTLAVPIACVTSSIYVGSALGTIAEPLAQSLGWRGAVACFGLFSSAAILNASLLVSNHRSYAGSGYGVVVDDGSRPRHRPPPPPSPRDYHHQHHHHQHQHQPAARCADDHTDPLVGGGVGSQAHYDSISGGTSMRARAGDLRVATRRTGSPSRGDGVATSTIGIICSSPKLLLLYLGSGIRYMAGMSMLSWNPVYFKIVFPGDRRMMVYAVNATVSVAVCGTVSQLLGAKCFDHLTGTNGGGGGSSQPGTPKRHPNGNRSRSRSRSPRIRSHSHSRGQSQSQSRSRLLPPPPGGEGDLASSRAEEGLREGGDSETTTVYESAGAFSGVSENPFFADDDDDDDDDDDERFENVGERLGSGSRGGSAGGGGSGSRSRGDWSLSRHSHSSATLSFTGLSARPPLSVLEGSDDDEDLLHAFVGSSSGQHHPGALAYGDDDDDTAARTTSEKDLASRESAPLPTAQPTATVAAGGGDGGERGRGGGGGGGGRGRGPLPMAASPRRQPPHLSPWLLGGPALLMALGGAASVVLFMAERFPVALAALYLTWLLGEGWFTGAITAVQHLLPRGRIRDEGVGLFLACNVLLGAADVLAISQEPMSTQSTADDDGGGDDDGADGAVRAARRTMLLSVSAAYFAAALLFCIAMKAPRRTLRSIV